MNIVGSQTKRASSDRGWDQMRKKSRTQSNFILKITYLCFVHRSRFRFSFHFFFFHSKNKNIGKRNILYYIAAIKFDLQHQYSIPLISLDFLFSTIACCVIVLWTCCVQTNGWFQNRDAKKMWAGEREERWIDFIPHHTLQRSKSIVLSIASFGIRDE